MDFNSTVDLIINDLEEARKIIDDFRNYPGVPLLQVELAKSKCKSAAEVIALLKSSVVTEPETRPENKPVSAPKRKPEPILEMDAEPVEEIVPQPDRAITTEKPVKTEKNTESTIIADTFITNPDTINEQIGGRKDDSDLLGSMTHRKIEALSDAIGINDRFLFIRELFNGSSETYNQAITKLDETNSLEDARAVILSYAGEIKEDGAASLLYDLVKRKFAGNE
jgi:hypothetical protein